MRALVSTHLFLFACASLGCGARTETARRSLPREEAPHVLVLDARWLTEGNALVVSLDPVVEALETAPVHAERASLGGDPACMEDVSCVRARGREARATHVLAIELAGLGQTMVLRVRLIGTSASGSDVVRQRVLESVTRERVETSLAEMTVELVSPFVPAEAPRRAWYERGYVYAIGAALVAGAIGTGISVHRYRDGRPDEVIVPP